MTRSRLEVAKKKGWTSAGPCKKVDQHSHVKAVIFGFKGVPFHHVGTYI